MSIEVSIGITSHGSKRLSERLPGLSRNLYHSHLRKAWSSKECSQTIIMLRQQNTEPRYKTKYKYRLLSGMVYVFQYWKEKDKIILITCFSHQDPESTQLSQEFSKWVDGKTTLE